MPKPVRRGNTSGLVGLWNSIAETEALEGSGNEGTTGSPDLRRANSSRRTEEEECRRIRENAIRRISVRNPPSKNPCSPSTGSKFLSATNQDAMQRASSLKFRKTSEIVRPTFSILKKPVFTDETVNEKPGSPSMRQRKTGFAETVESEKPDFSACEKTDTVNSEVTLKVPELKNTSSLSDDESVKAKQKSVIYELSSGLNSASMAGGGGRRLPSGGLGRSKSVKYARPVVFEFDSDSAVSSKYNSGNNGPGAGSLNRGDSFEENGQFSSPRNKKMSTPFAKFQAMDQALTQIALGAGASSPGPPQPKPLVTSPPPPTPSGGGGGGGLSRGGFTGGATGGGGGTRVIRSATSAKETILAWIQHTVNHYPNVEVTNFSTTWNDGLAFCALIHAFYPEAFEWSSLESRNRRYNFTLAFQKAEDYGGICPLLDVDDMVRMRKPDWKCVFTYVQSFYRRFRNGRDPPKATRVLMLDSTTGFAKKATNITETNNNDSSVSISPILTPEMPLVTGSDIQSTKSNIPSLPLANPQKRGGVGVQFVLNTDTVVEPFAKYKNFVVKPLPKTEFVKTDGGGFTAKIAPHRRPNTNPGNFGFSAINPGSRTPGNNPSNPANIQKRPSIANLLSFPTEKLFE